MFSYVVMIIDQISNALNIYTVFLSYFQFHFHSLTFMLGTVLVTLDILHVLNILGGEKVGGLFKNGIELQGPGG